LDTAYSGREFIIDLVNLDNDIAELEVKQFGERLTGVASHVDETGLRKNFTVELPKPPNAAVTIDLKSSDVTEGTIDPEVLIFDQYNWNITQTVFVTGVDDDEADGDVGFRIEFDTKSSDDAVNNIKWFFYMYCKDDDSLMLSSTHCDVYESGQKCTLTVELPVWQQGEFEEMNYTISSKDPAIASVFPTYIRFTESNWNLPQYVNVSAVDNSIDNIDAITKVYFNGTLAFTHHNAEGRAGMTSAVSTSGWGVCQDEYAAVCSLTAEIGTTYACEYGTRCEPNRVMKKATTIHKVDVTSIDDDTANIIISPLEPTVPLKQQLNGDWTAVDDQTLLAYANNDPTRPTTDEAGRLGWKFDVQLTSEPIAEVTLLAVSSNEEEGVCCHSRLECPRTLTFSPDNWMVPQTVVVRGADDDTVDFDKIFIINTGPSASDDPLYDKHFSFEHAFLNRDDDNFGVVVSAVGSSSEAGRPALINARLLSMPKAPILFSISSNIPSEGIPSPSIFVLSQQNWRDGVNIESVGQPDILDDGDVQYILSCTPITTQDPEYLAEKPQYVQIVNEDDPVNKLEIDVTTDNTMDPLTIGYDATTPTDQACVIYEDSTVSVAGGKYCTIKIQPTTWWMNEGAYQELRVTVTAGNTAEGMLVLADGTTAPTLMLTFQNHTWAAGATVRLVGVDDQKVDSFGLFNVRVTAEIDALTRELAVVTKAISFKKIGGGRNVKAATVDDDEAGVIFVRGCNVTSESGDRCTYLISLQTEPAYDVVFHAVSDNENEGKVDKGSTVTITPKNWMTPQEIEIIGQDDAAFDKTQPYVVTIGPSESKDTMYANWEKVVSMENTDNDIAEMIILQDGEPIRGFAKHTDETGAQQSFTIQLPPDSQPRAAVMIEISSSDQTEVMVIPSIIVFTPTDFMDPQTVQLVGQDDNDMDGDTIVRIQLTTHSTDISYADVSWFFYMYNNDDDGLTLSRDSCVVSEWGNACDVDVSMRAWRDQEYDLMEFSVFSSDEGEGYGTPDAIRFNISNWWIPQTVTVHGVDDLIDDGTVQFRIDLVGLLTFKEGFENEKNSFSVTLDVQNEDDDTAGVLVKQLSNTTNEQGTLTASYTVKLLTEPVKIVYIPSQVLTPANGRALEGSVKPAQLTFNKNNWMIEQTVTVSGEDDWVKDYPQPFTVQIGPAYSLDLPYKNKHMSRLEFINLDDDEVGLVTELEMEDGSYAPNGTMGETSEDGQVGPGKILVKLNSEPKSTVLFTVSSSAPKEGTVTPNIIAFSSDDWSMEQTLTVNGEDDAFLDGDVSALFFTLLALAFNLKSVCLTNYDTLLLCLPP
jgi:hypothetical protein